MYVQLQLAYMARLLLQLACMAECCGSLANGVLVKCREILMDVRNGKRKKKNWR